MKFFLAICLAVVLVVLMVGCGGRGGELDGRWEGRGITVEFSEGKYTLNNGQEISSSGTFSISGNQIEIIVERIYVGGTSTFGRQGHIFVDSFSRTENTLTIGHHRFYRVN